ncbi:MAG: phosphate ABC transporter substrate-binding protein PstS [Gemmatimonadaceae bacterium]
MRARALLLIAAGTLAVSTLAAQSVDLTGAGATFAYPIYSRWISDYVAKTGIRINYQSIGSGGGVRQLTERTVDFGASDAPVSDAELARLGDRRILHIPTVIGAVVAAYNLPGVTTTLRLSGPVLADIFQGRITKWNDSRIVALNPLSRLPNRNILVVYRADGSGTTYVFSEYLSTISPGWARGPGKGMSLSWPVGLGGKGNEGVAGQVRQITGAIGYVELTYARQNRLAFADVQNAAGAFVTASVSSMSAAASGATKTIAAGGDTRVSIVNAPGKGSYPIASFTWVLVDARNGDAAKAKKVADFLRFALTDGQKSAAALYYAPLPAAVIPSLLRQVGGVASAR